MGFVTKVEDAPATIEEIVRASHLFSDTTICQQGTRKVGRTRLTHSIVQQVLGRLVRAHVDGPGGDVAQQHGAEPSVQAADAIFDPDGACSAGEALVYNARRALVGAWTEGALGLQAGFDDIERAGHDTGSDTG